MASIYDINNSTDLRHKALTVPKKRKNIWRPYDSNGKRCAHPEYVSGSDSDSNSSSLDTTVGDNLEDPVKRRKQNMLKYHDRHGGKEHVRVNRRFPHVKHHMSSNHTVTDATLDESHKTTSTSGPIALQGNSDDAHTSSVYRRRRNMYRLSPNLVESAENDVTSATELTSSFEARHRDFDDRTKSHRLPLYTGSDDDESVETREHFIQGNTTRGNRRDEDERNEFHESEAEGDIAISKDTEGKSDSDSEKSDGKEGKKVPETKKGICLIDLIEEIEADAIKKEQEEVEKTKQRNANIVKLLEQCNHVKLQALDYLMSNVVIQDSGTSRNEKVQKMLKGDKITSVNMLDVIELQVEMGLN